MEEQQEEIELNFRLDGNGRTADPNDQKTDPASANSNDASLDYESNTFMTNIESDGESFDQKTLDDILFDCQITDSGLMPRTFWMPCEGSPARCTLEQFALDVFHQHVPSGFSYDKNKSGAEWWVQIRPSPPAGRYAMHDPSSSSDDSFDMTESGISWHFDKDEDLRLLTGGSTYIHPHISTVTYLTDLGCPTIAANIRANNLSGEWIVPGGKSGESGAASEEDSNVKGFLSWPKKGKHMKFDGRYLHAALPDMMEPGAFQEQCQYPKDGSEQETKILGRRHRRVTFLVNVWLNYKPFNVHAFPATMVDKLSGRTDEDRKRLVFKSSDAPSDPQTVQVEVDPTADNCTLCNWPLGDCGSGEQLVAQFPKSVIQVAGQTGGNVRIVWKQTPSDNEDNAIKTPLFGIIIDNDDGTGKRKVEDKQEGTKNEESKKSRIHSTDE